MALCAIFSCQHATSIKNNATQHAEMIRFMRIQRQLNAFKDSIHKHIIHTTRLTDDNLQTTASTTQRSAQKKSFITAQPNPKSSEKHPKKPKRKTKQPNKTFFLTFFVLVGPSGAP
jgi:hypothetical protein